MLVIDTDAPDRQRPGPEATVHDVGVAHHRLRRARPDPPFQPHVRRHRVHRLPAVGS